MKYGTLLLYMFFCGCTLLGQTEKTSLEGLSSKRLSKIDSFFNAQVHQGKLPGAVALISRNNMPVYFKAFGYADMENGTAMNKEAIFGLASMTKLVTNIAALMLYEEGHFLMNHTLARYLPEFEGVQVRREIGDSVYLEKPKTPILIRDLFRHTSGLKYWTEEYSQADINLNRNKSIEEFIQNLVSVPLYQDPGTVFQYSYSTDVLGYLIEKLSGQNLRAFFKERIFGPLEMVDTDFFVPKHKADRLVSEYKYNGKKLVKLASKENAAYLKLPNIYSGGQGLVSTAQDYSHLLHMLLNYGQYKGVQLLGRKTVALMISDQLIDVKDHGNLPSGQSFGLGVAVVTDAGQLGELFSSGAIFWGGAKSTSFWVDHKEKLLGVYMSQVSPYDYNYYNQYFKNLAYQAIQE